MSAHITELEAVNIMLQSIGETRVNGLDTGLIEATMAYDRLVMANRSIQLAGWHVNTWKNYEIFPDASHQYVLGTDVLCVDTVGQSKSYDVLMRRSLDGSKYVLWDNKNHVDTWANGPTSLFVDIIFLVPFTDLTPALQNYVTMRAAHDYQKGMISSQVLFQFTEENVVRAKIAAEEEDAANTDNNCLTASPSVAAMAYRNNWLYGI